MPFVSAPGLKGMVYVPKETARISKKYDCRECFACQLCAEERCALCRSQKDPAEKPCRRPRKPE